MYPIFKIIKSLKVLLIVLMAIGVQYNISAKTSGKIKPQWIKNIPVAQNSSYRFVVTKTQYLSGIDSTRKSSKKELIYQVEKIEKIEIEEILKSESNGVFSNGSIKSMNDKEVYNLQIKIEGKIENLNYIIISEYDDKDYFYTLYAVAHSNHVAIFDDVRIKSKYGARGLVRSIIPGWGQMYKGSQIKGLSMFVGEIALGIGVLVCENTRASYEKKMREQPKYASQYNSKADSWANYRNACIGGAVALYVYNLIDALVANGAERVVVVKRGPHFSMQPMVSNDANGISLCYNF